MRVYLVYKPIVMNTRRQFIKTAWSLGAGMGILGLGNYRAWAAMEFAGSGVDEVMRFPRATPESQGVSSASIRQFIAAANASGFSWHSFMLLRHGHVIAEGWWKPYEPQLIHSLYSLSKSFTSTAIGLLVKEGKLDVGAKVVSFFPDEVPAQVSENLGQITVRNMLTMNTGHGADTMPKMRESIDSWVKAYLAQPVEFAPGTHFLYNTGNTYMLGAILHKITGQTLEQYLAPRLFKPLGITGYDWEVSPQGLNTAGYGLRVRTEDIACLGQLYLQKGQWKGAEILTPAWVEEATSKQTTSQVNNGDWSEGYGYQFWRCTHGFYRGDGAFGQYCIVMPQYDAVMVVTGQTPDMQKSMNIIWDSIPGGMKEGSLPADTSGQSGLKADVGGLALPVVQGIGKAEIGKKYDQQKWLVGVNDLGIERVGLVFSDKGCVLNVLANGKETTMEFGWGQWVSNAKRQPYVFSVKDFVPMPTRIAGTAAWIDEHTLQLNVRFIEAIFGDRVRFVFDGDGVKIDFLNSNSELAKKTDDPRKGLEGHRA